MIFKPLWFLFDVRGRLSRDAYRTALLGLLLLDRVRDLLVGDAGSARTAALLLACNFLVSIALDAKRLHDTGRSALWILWIDLAAIAAVAVAMSQYTIDPALLRMALGPMGGQAALASSLGTTLAFGLALGAVIRATWLSFAGSSEQGERYERAPSVRAEVTSPPLDLASADALIAKALEMRAAEAGKAAESISKAPPYRASFGKRRA